MQQAPYAWSGYPQEPHRSKHRLEEQDDSDQVNHIFTAGTGTGPASTGVTFSEANLQAANAFVAATKRRKGNTGQVALPADFEPQFEGLSLRSDGQNGLRLDDTLAQDKFTPRSPVDSPLGTGSTTLPSSARGRASFLNTADGSRGRRDGTPIVSQASSSSSNSGSLHHRKRSSGRNRARRTTSANDIDMKPAPRYDPARPHVVFVDSLSDSDEEVNDDTSETEATSGGLSSLSTPGNSPSSSDTEDTISPASQSSIRPIQMNKRLRDHLRKQAMLQRLDQKPPSDAILADAPSTTGGAGIRERGLVLYRPLTFGIVEEPDEEDRQSENDLHIPTTYDTVEIEELPSDGRIARNPTEGFTASNVQSMEVDEEMEIDE